MSNLVSMEWVVQHLEDPKLVLIDCRFTLGQPQAGQKVYQNGHIPGAFHLDLEKDLSSPIQRNGGRHPLPEPELLAKKLGELGIDQTKHVVAYDNQGGAMASRFWWILSYLGHKNVSVMNGTFKQWQEKNYPVSQEVPLPRPTLFVPQIQQNLLVDMGEVKQKLADPSTMIIDSREPKRYLGEEEPIDAIAGHIPGAKNLFWKEVLNEQGFWKSEAQLRQHFAQLAKAEQLIVYCGSGVTATPNVLALMQSGFSKVKLYAGSWSDWISYPDNPIARGEEKK